MVTYQDVEDNASAKQTVSPSLSQKMMEQRVNCAR